METIGKSSFLLYFNFAKQLRMLTLEERGEVITAIFDYAEHGKTEEKLSERSALVFSFISDVLDRDRRVYESRCDRNRENGKRGGRPTKKSTATAEPYFSEKTERFFKKPKKADTDNDTDTETDTETETDTDTDTENEKEIDFAYVGGGALEGARSAPNGPYVPAAPRSTQKNLFLDEEAYRALLLDGVDGTYIRKNQKAATQYARKHGMTTRLVLLEWWQRNAAENGYKKQTPKKDEEKPKPRVGELGCSFDIDEFAQAALERGLRWHGE